MSEPDNELQEQHLAQVAWLRENGHMMTRGGKEFPLQRGLFLLARLHGLSAMETTCLGFDMDAGWATFKASATGERGTYSAHGDATTSNVGGMVKPHFYRMAETRAVNRSLRYYLALNLTSFEELGPEPEAGDTALGYAAHIRASNRDRPPEGPAGASATPKTPRKVAKPIVERDDGWRNAMDLLKEAVIDKGMTMEEINSKIREQRNVDLIELDKNELEKVRKWVQSK